MQAYSEDVRERIIQDRKEGMSVVEIARKYRLSTRSVDRYWKQYKETGNCVAGKGGGRRRSRLEKHDQTLRMWLEEKKDITLEELQKRCWKELGVRIGIMALWYRIKYRLGFSYKKKRYGPVNKTPK
jgi:transposase